MVSPVRARFQEQGMGSATIHNMTLQGQCHRTQSLTVNLWVVGSSVKAILRYLSQSQEARPKMELDPILGLDCPLPHSQATGQTTESSHYFNPDWASVPDAPIFQPPKSYRAQEQALKRGEKVMET